MEMRPRLPAARAEGGPTVNLAEQIIDGGPYRGGDSLPIEVQTAGDDALNQLRDELLELRQLRAAAAARERFVIDTIRGDDENDPDSVVLFHDNRSCRWDAYPDAPANLAKLVRRADQHTKDCT